jgi:hypothetical protein
MLSRERVVEALKNLKEAHNDMCVFFHERDVQNFANDICRRNLMLSVFHEHYFAKAFAEQYGGATNDGRTGEADIIITSTGREIECKLTTITATGSFNLQTDFVTLQRKGSLDYLYVLTNREFNEFAVLYFEGLTPDDFHPPSVSSRNRAKMKKYSARQKCTVLFGDMINKSEIEIAKAKSRLDACSLRAEKKREKLMNSITFWQNNEATFTIKTNRIQELAT